jgi:pyridoxine 4-dehydrogenase
VPFEESVGALADFQREGKIRHVGVSNVSVRQLEQASKIAPVASVQNEYNLDNRESEDVLKACERLKVAFLPWYPLGAGGALRNAKIKTVAKKLDATPAQVALAWLLKRSSVVLPIPGTNSLEHLEENVKAASLELADADFKMLSGG